MNYLNVFLRKYAIWTFLVGVGIGALVAHKQSLLKNKQGKITQK